MQLTVAIKTKEVGIGWPWVKGTGELPNIQRENVTIFAPPPHVSKLSKMTCW